MKNLSANLMEMSNVEMMKANGGTTASRIITGRVIVDPFTHKVWDIRQSLGRFYSGESKFILLIHIGTHAAHPIEVIM